MDFIKNFNPTPMNIAKLAAVLAAALLVCAVAAQIFTPSLPISIMPRMEQTDAAYPSEMGYSYASDYSDGGYGYASAKPVNAPSAMAYGEAGGMATLSSRNVMAITNINPSIAPVPPMSGGAGNTAEAYEVTDYNASIETRKLEQTCDAFAELKAKSYVVFENSNKYETGCSYSFKVEHSHVDEVLAWIKNLDPKSLSENSYTIKKQVEDFTSQEDTLKKKLAAIDDTLLSAEVAYDEVTRLATQTRDASSLTQIIDSRIQIIERLTQERLSISSQLEYLTRAKAEQLDRLDYTYFNANVYESKYVDTRWLAESWKQAVRDVVRVINDAVQGVTINLIALFFLVLQWALYALILLLIVKYGWQLAVKIWRK